MQGAVRKNLEQKDKFYSQFKLLTENELMNE